MAIAGHDTARLKSERVQGRVHGAMEAHAATQPVKSDGVTLLPDALDLTGSQLRAKALLVRPADLRPLDRVESDGEAHHLALDGFATRLGAVRVIVRVRIRVRIRVIVRVRTRVRVGVRVRVRVRVRLGARGGPRRWPWSRRSPPPSSSSPWLGLGLGLGLGLELEFE